ncbi:MAG: galactose-1-phosphate uridylyltransferase [Actinomycetota bacterium]
MSTLRLDRTTGSWAVLAPRRSARPHTALAMERSPLPERDPTCPFCPGNEEETPPEIARYPDGARWNVRVVPNLFAALGSETGNGHATTQGVFQEIPGAGSHEVIVESPRHDARLDELEEHDVVRVVETWRARTRDLTARPEIRGVVVFKNFGPLAGTSLVHTHSQIIATSVALPAIERRVDVATRFRDEQGGCVYETLLEEERARAVRVVDEADGFTVLAPFASASPYETWIVPREHRSAFADLGDDCVEQLARALIRSVRAIRRACDDPDYNLMIMSADGEDSSDAFHWFVRIVPKLTTPAGFELASGMSINTVAPEDAAAALRSALEPIA